MKKILSLLSLAALTIGLLGSCSKINERLDNLEKKVSGIENEQIASINSQISGITSSISDLGQIRSDISSLKQSAENHSQDIFALQEADEALKDRILNLEDYLDNVLPNYAEKKWVEATFSTLEQYEATCDTIAKIDARIGALDTKLSKDIQTCADSLTKWVNKTFEGYYTAAQMDAKLTQMKTDIDSAKAAGKITDAKADSIATELTATKTAVDTAKAAIRAEYKAAVKSAIEESEGKLTKALNDAIATVNGTITSLTGRVDALDREVDALTGRIEKLEGMIQSVTIVPVYSDGSVKATKDGLLYLDIIVEPAGAVAGLTKDSLKVLVNKVKAKTKAVDVDTVTVADIKVDEVKGTVTARAAISTELPVESGKALTVAVNVRNELSDYTTKFYPVTLSDESNVNVETVGDSTKVTIKADADFPGSVMGNIEVEKLEETKPTSITVKGIGTVIFDKTATGKIKGNAEDAGATSVLFKVEDVTTTKPVPNADVVLEVTMKAVNENGTEVFCEGKADGEVTIQIPLEEAYYVNSVTLVNDAGDPIEGGVIPGSQSFKDSILTFKVQHFSKYAVDYVTREEYKAVTGVSIEPAEVTLPVGDSATLNVIFNPTDATNKKVTWSSNNSAIATVDASGKVKAIAFGQATITVTANEKDGGQTASCAVKVTETKTMADILKTTTGIPASENLTPPADAWVNSTDPDCKAFVGVDKDGDKLFTAWKSIPGGTEDEIVTFGLLMTDTFVKTDENTYAYTDNNSTVKITMTEGKFTSCEFDIKIDSYKCLNGIYAAPKSNLPDGALSGVFSVSANKKVHFSKGNLVATIKASGSPTGWKFAANQYDYLGEGGANKTIGNSAGDIDLFGWSTSATKYGISKSTTAGNYSGDFVDWGTAIDSKGTWRTLNKMEWNYLFNARTVNGGKGAGKSYSLNITYGGKMGVVLYPDDYTGSVLSGTVDSLPEGVVFLPAAGKRDGSNVNDVGGSGLYWSSEPYLTKNKAYYVEFSSTDVSPKNNDLRRYGYSVRLVTDVPADGTEQYKNNSNPEWF